MSSDPEAMNLLLLDTTTEHTASMKKDNWRRQKKNYGTLMCIFKVMQLLLGLQIKHLDGFV